MNSSSREGGCLCGAVRYRARGAPLRTVVCHCTYCQRCTGSAFSTWVAFEQPAVDLSGKLSVYQHVSDESGRWLRLHFCPACGTTLASTYEKGRGQISLLAGTFDDTAWIKVDRHVWTRSAQHWIAIPPDAVAFEKSSDAPHRPPR